MNSEELKNKFTSMYKNEFKKKMALTNSKDKNHFSLTNNADLKKKLGLLKNSSVTETINNNDMDELYQQDKTTQENEKIKDAFSTTNQLIKELITVNVKTQNINEQFYNEQTIINKNQNIFNKNQMEYNKMSNVILLIILGLSLIILTVVILSFLVINK